MELNLSGLLRSGAFFSLAALTVGALSAVSRFFDSLTCFQHPFTDPSLFPHHNSLALSFFYPYRRPFSLRPWTKITLMSAPARATARPLESGALGERSLRCCGTAYVLDLTVASMRSQSSNTSLYRDTKSQTKKSKSSSTSSN